LWVVSSSSIDGASLDGLIWSPDGGFSAPILELSQPLFSKALFVKVVCNWLVSFEVLALVLAKGLLDSWKRRIWVLEPVFVR
jgi:hypothetical protein